MTVPQPHSNPIGGLRVMSPSRCFVPVFLVAAVFALSPAFAQVDRGTISGTVTDSTGAVLPGALVELQQRGPSAVSDAQGHFLISNLLPGSYTLMVSHVGFAPFQTSVTVAAGQVAHVDA